MSASTAEITEITQSDRPSLAETLRFYVFAASAVVLAVAFVVVTVVDATR